MAKINIDGVDIEVQDGITLIQACEIAGVEIPRFCYHEKLNIAGNCRACLVEVEKFPKPVPSCTQPVADGMIVRTGSNIVEKARKGVMEFLLINHPLDCPICDQGGECDLQDQVMAYGRSYTRYNEPKRAVEDKEMGVLIKTHMTRCIHCTRCVRFMEEVAGVPELGAVNRGEDMEITAINAGLSSELSGNIIDLCPVGALTSKPYAFTARSWELRRVESVDILDPMCPSIRVDCKGGEVMRILPIRNDEINEEWISDVTRFSYDGLKRQRLDTAMIRKNGLLAEVDYDDAVTHIKDKILLNDANNIGVIAGDLTDVETMFIAKKFMEAIGSKNYDCRQDGALLSNKHRCLYKFNNSMQEIESADMYIIIGCDVRHEAPLLNTRIRKGVMAGADVFVIGDELNLTYEYKHLGNNPWILKQLADKEHPHYKILEGYKNPVLILGSSVMQRNDVDAVVCYALKLARNIGAVRDDWYGYNVLQKAASRVGGMDIGFIPKTGGKATMDMLKKCKMLFMLGSDEVNVDSIPRDTFIVYFGHTGDNIANRADVILPSPAYTEKDATYVNIEGLVRRTNKAAPQLGVAKDEWRIFLDIAYSLSLDLGDYRTLDSVRVGMSNVSPIFKNIYEKVLGEMVDGREMKIKDLSDEKISRSSDMFKFYNSNAISRSSKIMAMRIKELMRLLDSEAA